MLISGREKYLAVTVLLVTISNARSQDESEAYPKNPCTLVQKLVGSATLCISNLGGDGGKVNLDSPRDISNLLNSDKLACVVKCVMTDQGLVNSEGKLDPGGLVNFQANIPDDMKSKLTMDDLKPCLELAVKFDPSNCKTYSEYSQCQLRLLVKAFQPSALDCFTKIPGVGRLFVMLQSAMSRGDGQHLTGIRERLSKGKFREWLGGGNGSVVDLIKNIDF